MDTESLSSAYWAVAQRTGVIMACFFGFHTMLTHTAHPESILQDRGSCCNTYRKFAISTIKKKEKRVKLKEQKCGVPVVD